MKKTLQTMLFAVCFFLFLAAPARAYYSPEQGRWLNRDPIGEKGGKHLYAFVELNRCAVEVAVGVGDWSGQSHQERGCWGSCLAAALS